MNYKILIILIIGSFLQCLYDIFIVKYYTATLSVDCLGTIFKNSIDF